MLAESPRVPSAGAAQIVGVGYEGFRSYLKRGLLGRVGMLPGFYAAASAAHDDPAPRSGWTTFGFADLCLMRLAKLLMDAGFSFASANRVVSQHEIWSKMAHDEVPTERYLLVWPPYADHILFDKDELHHIPDRVADLSAKGVFTLINIKEIQEHVIDQLTPSYC